MKNSILLAVVLGLSLTSLYASADPITLGEDGTVRSVLKAHVGKTVSVMLKSGQELSGKVTAVTADATHISQLTGKEFYDAVISNRNIAAVVIRVK